MISLRVTDLLSFKIIFIVFLFFNDNFKMKLIG